MSDKPPPLTFQLLAAGAEHLVMGHLMRRNVLAYKAPPMNEGYDLICIHPDPRHQPEPGERPQVRVQVKSRYQSDSNRGVPVRKKTRDAFDFAVVVFLNVGDFYRGPRDGSTGMRPVEYYTLPPDVLAQMYDPKGGWDVAHLRRFKGDLVAYRDETGFELIAAALGVPRPTRPPGVPDVDLIGGGDDATGGQPADVVAGP